MRTSAVRLVTTWIVFETFRWTYAGKPLAE
jgi:hypothetical protein